MNKGKESLKRLKEMSYSQPDGTAFIQFRYNPRDPNTMNGSKSNALVQYLENHHSQVTILLQKLGFPNNKVMHVKFQRLTEGIYQMDHSDKEMIFFHTSNRLRQTIFDVTNAPVGFLFGFDLQGRRTSLQYLSGHHSATFLQGMHQPFVLYVPMEMKAFAEFNFFMFFDGEMIITGSEKIRVVHHTHVFHVHQLEKIFGSMRNVSEKFQIRLVSNGNLATLHSMGDHFHEFHDFYQVLNALGLKLGQDYFYCCDEIPDEGKIQELSTLKAHPWIASEVGPNGSYIWVK